MLYMILLILFLLCLGVVTSSFLAGFTPMEKRPPFYRDEAFRRRMEWSFLPAVALVIGLINISLTYTLAIGGVAVLLSNWVLRPPAEALIVEPLFRLYARGHGDGNAQNA
ncbi:MAG: hypothetical protein HPY67_08250 [Syntrophaceae bacterium]|nr:hypothetical protein [Syntrophaceae bacterium]